MATGKAWGLASSLWEALLAWGAGGGPVEATASTASTATYCALTFSMFTDKTSAIYKIHIYRPKYPS